LIQVHELRKSFGDVRALDGVTFEAAPGEIFGLLGPNGAGKTTTIHCLCGLLKPGGGTVRVGGHEARSREARALMGVVPQEIALYEELNARENLDYWGGAQGLRGAKLKARVDEMLELVGLADRAREAVKKYSGGMKRRLNFACGILHAPRALLLDEPTVGVDPQSRVRLLELVRDQARNGACVLYTTHYMEEAEQLCDRLAVVDHGRVIARGTLAELRAQGAELDLLRLEGTFVVEAVRAALSGMDGLQIHECGETLVRLSMREAPRHLAEIFARLAGAGAQIRGTSLKQPSLETLFVKLTGKELRE
jgi:ABC-2 type transport system ATP-binding protein